jgi:hypothetical protein
MKMRDILFPFHNERRCDTVQGGPFLTPLGDYRRVTSMDMFVTLCFFAYTAGATFCYRYVAPRTSPAAAVPEPVEAEIVPLEPIPDPEAVLPVAEDAAKWRQRAVSAVARGKDLEGRLAAISSEIAEWKRRALIAEALLRKGRSAPTTADHRFRQLRTLLAKELHPDHARTRTVDRAELFKVLWPEIEAIERLP